MKAVMSLWTGAEGWELTREGALVDSYGAALCCRHFEHTEFVADVRGVEVADRLRWRFTAFRSDLEDLCPHYMRGAWMLGKLAASEIQNEAHVHLDLDLFLHAPLPRRLLEARVAVHGKDNVGHYRQAIAKLAMADARVPIGTVPFNTALLLWNDLKLRDRYVREAREAAQRLVALQYPNWCVCTVAEQAVLADVLRRGAARAEEAIPMPNLAAPCDFDDARFTHAWGRSKRSSRWLREIERSFRERCPEEYRDFLRGWQIFLERGEARP